MSLLRARPAPSRYRLPIQETVRDLLHDLLGRTVTATKEAVPLDEADAAVVATYVDQQGGVAALALCDVAFANGVGAALSLVPIPLAEERTRAGEVPPNLLENVQEVLNIMAKLLNSATAPHARLAELHRGAAELPAPVADLLAAPKARKDFAVAVEGYGGGRIALLSS